VQTSFAKKLPAGAYTCYWKIWLNGYTVGFDSGTLTVIALPCSMGGKLQMEQAAIGKIVGTMVEGETTVVAMAEDMPNTHVTVDRSSKVE
jgi:hypothetical protein